jgi:DNA repair protein RecO (recombination protein O)
MEWTDQAIVLGTRRHGESAVVLELMTSERGRHLGLVRGGRSRRLAPMLQPGNRVSAIWRSRLDDNLGHFSIEPLEFRAGRLIETAESIFVLQTLAAHLRLLAEREPHPRLYAIVNAALTIFAEPDPTSLADICIFLARFELSLLDELGFGLDLESCATTGARTDLAFVSPRSGRAVSRAGAVGYEDRLLPLARFMLGQHGSNQGPAEIRDAFRLTSHFLQRDIYAPRGLREPPERQELLARLGREPHPAGL